ncbi:MAG TPA: aquaporin [Flavisolibacter sp.]
MKKYMAEFMGTFILVFCGTGAAVVNELHNGVITHAGVAITFGLIVMAMIFTFGERSGSHLNPAVSLAFALHKTFPVKEVLPYTISQLAGGTAASFALKILFPASVYLGATLPSGTALQSWVLEFFLTLFLMLTVLHVSERGKEKGMVAALAVGAIVAVEAMFAGPVSGASMNPARSLAPALASGHLQHVWIYLSAPLAGSLSAVFLYRLMK